MSYKSEQREAAQRLEIVQQALRSAAEMQRTEVAEARAAGRGGVRDHYDRLMAGDFTPREAEYQATVRNAPEVPGGHVERPMDEDLAKYNPPGRLYTVTTMAIHDIFGGERTPVICTSFERAQQIVLKNEGDIWETSNNLVVIEETIPDWLYGGHPMCNQYWYAWRMDPADYERELARERAEFEAERDPGERWPESALDFRATLAAGRYVPIETPPQYERVHGWGIG